MENRSQSQFDGFGSGLFLYPLGETGSIGATFRASQSALLRYLLYFLKKPLTNRINNSKN